MDLASAAILILLAGVTEPGDYRAESITESIEPAPTFAPIPACESGCPFDNAAIIPKDVQIFLHIESPAGLMNRRSAQPLLAAATEMLEQGAIAQAWTALAQSAGMKEAELLQLLLSDGLTLSFRRDEVSGEFDWVALAPVDDAAWSAFARRVDFRAQAPILGVAISTLPEQEIAFARVSPLLIAGPRASVGKGLFRDVLSLALEESDAQPLSKDAVMAHAVKLGEAEIGIFLRHDEPLGGASAAAIDLGDKAIIARHTSQFANSPFGDAPRPATLELPVFDRLADASIAVLAQPLEMPTGPLASFIRARLPQGALSPELEENLGERCYWVVVERSVDGDDGDSDLVDIVVVIEVRDPEPAPAQIDSLCAGLGAVLDDLANVGAEDAPKSDFTDRLRGELRTLPIGQAAERLMPALVAADDVSLNWLTTSGPDGHWWVTGSGAEAVHAIAAALARVDNVSELAEHEPIDLDWQFGFVRGPEAGAHARRLGEKLSRALAAEPEDARAVAAVTRALAAALESIDRCIWRADLPGLNRVRSTWVFYLDDAQENPDEVRDLRAVDGR